VTFIHGAVNTKWFVFFDKQRNRPAAIILYGTFFHFRPTSKRSVVCYTWRRSIFLWVEKTGHCSKTILLELKNEKRRCTYGIQELALA